MIPKLLRFDEKNFLSTCVGNTRRYLSLAGIEKLVIGASTGLDSTTSLYLAREIVGVNNVLAVHLPHHEHDRSSDEYNRICDDIGLSNRYIDDIRPMLDAWQKKGNTIQMTNMVSRVQRAVILDYSHKLDAMVFGTLNRTEYELGEFPIYALDASIQPLRVLFKTQVRHFAGYLGAPEYIQDRMPTIDTWLGKTDQIMRTRIVNIGLPIVDQILRCHLDLREDHDTISKRGFSCDDVEFVIHMHEKNKFKQTIPYIPAGL